MSLTFNRIVPLIINGDLTPFEKRLQEIAEIKQKLANPEAQSFYFRKGIESKRVRLKKLLSEYDEYKDFINGNEISDFQDKIKENKSSLEGRTTRGFLNTMAYQSIECTINRLEEAIVVKKKYGKIDNPDQMVEII